MPTFLPSSDSAAARFAVTVDLPTPPLPEPTQMMFDTSASAPSGRPPLRPSFVWSAPFSVSVSTSKATSTCVTPSSADTDLATAVWKWLRIGQPGVVKDTMTATRPSSWMSIERTMPSSTIELRSSGSMTASSALRISSRDGMSDILANVRSLALVVVLALTGCGAAHDRAAPADWRAGAEAVCFHARSLLAPLQPPSSFRSAELVAGAVALALRQELDRTASLGTPPAGAARRGARAAPGARRDRVARHAAGRGSASGRAAAPGAPGDAGRPRRRDPRRPGA